MVNAPFFISLTGILLEDGFLGLTVATNQGIYISRTAGSWTLLIHSEYLAFPSLSKAKRTEPRAVFLLRGLIGMELGKLPALTNCPGVRKGECPVLPFDQTSSGLLPRKKSTGVEGAEAEGAEAHAIHGRRSGASSGAEAGDGSSSQIGILAARPPQLIAST